MPPKFNTLTIIAKVAFWTNVQSLRISFVLGEDEKLIMVPYDSDADQWPSMRKGHKAHWGVIFGLALMMPCKNKAFDNAKILDGYVSYLKPPLSQATIGKSNF